MNQPYLEMIHVTYQESRVPAASIGETTPVKRSEVPNTSRKSGSAFKKVPSTTGFYSLLLLCVVIASIANAQIVKSYKIYVDPVTSESDLTESIENCFQEKWNYGFLDYPNTIATDSVEIGYIQDTVYLFWFFQKSTCESHVVVRNEVNYSYSNDSSKKWVELKSYLCGTRASGKCYRLCKRRASKHAQEIRDTLYTLMMDNNFLPE